MLRDPGSAWSNRKPGFPTLRTQETSSKARPRSKLPSRSWTNRTAFDALHTSSQSGLAVAAWSSPSSAQESVRSHLSGGVVKYFVVHYMDSAGDRVRRSKMDLR